MAELNEEELISKKALEAPIKLANNFSKVVKELKEVIESGKELNKQFGSVKSVKDLNKATKQLSIEQKELEKTEKALAVAQSRNNKEYIQKQAKLKRLRRNTREQIKEEERIDDVYEQQSRNLLQLRKRYKSVAISKGVASKEAKQLRVQVQRLDNELKEVDASAGQFQRNVGNYKSAFKGAITTLVAVGAAVTGIVRVVGQAIKVSREYEDANATLNGILGQTAEQTESLRKQQLELGASTEFSASQVAKAQTELARLGQTQENIIAMTPGILGAATALGTDLASASELVAGQLNAFGLEADKSTELADVLTKSTQISALNFERLSTALGIVAPAAASVGVSVQRTTAILGAAADANIDASTAATALRNIYIDLSDKGLTFDEAMQQITNSTDKLSAANELFGKRGAVVASVIANNTDKINKNTISLENASGTAEEFANKQLNTLSGRVKLLNSAWEGFILSIENGDGVLGNLINGVLNGLTNVLGKLTPELKESENRLIKVNDEFTRQMRILKTGNLSVEARSKLINDINTNYGEYLPNLISEKDTLEELDTIQKEVNKNLLNKILLQEQEAEISKISKIIIQAQKELLELEIKREDAKNRLRKAGANEAKAIQVELDFINKSYNLNQSIIDEQNLKLSELNKQYSDLSDRLGLNSNETKNNTKETKNNNDENVKRVGILNRVLTAQEKLSERKSNVRGLFEVVFGESVDESGANIDAAVEKFDSEIKNLSKKVNETTTETKKSLLDQFSEISEGIYQSVGVAFDFFTDRNQAAIQENEQRLQQAQEARQRELTLVEENIQNESLLQQRRTEIRRRFDAEQQQIEREQLKRRRRQAIAEKGIAIAQIIADTARAIATVTAGQPFTAGLPQSAIIAAIGAAQIARVATAPIPAFEKGTNYSPEGLAMINEKGPELLEKNGKYSMVESKGATLQYLKRGTKVHTAEETTKLLASGAIDYNVSNDVKPNYNQNLIKEIKGIKNALKNQKQLHVNMSRKGIDLAYRRGQNISRILNNDFK